LYANESLTFSRAIAANRDLVYLQAAGLILGVLEWIAS
jgi:hypothetical protein